MIKIYKNKYTNKVLSYSYDISKFTFCLSILQISSRLRLRGLKLVNISYLPAEKI